MKYILLLMLLTGCVTTQVIERPEHRTGADIR